MHSDEISQIKQGNLEELDKIYLRLKPDYISYAKKSFPSLNIEEIEDTYHDSIIIFYQNIQRGLLTEIDTNLSTYIIQIGKMRLLKVLEKKQKRVNTLGDFKEKMKLDNLYDYRIDEVVKFVFSMVSDSCKHILQLFYFKKHSMDEIALILGYKNADVVKSKKNRCISKISESVTEMYFKDE